ncbi:HNH endonuclease signature motif containing protein, partial [Actinomadura adrarensis]
HDPAHGRTAYRPTTALRRTIEARHVTCAFPTCNRRSSRCDLDHTIPWGRGPTCQCNLAPLCRKHHRGKQTPGWRLVQPWPGLLIWITPSGSWHITLPDRQ